MLKLTPEVKQQLEDLQGKFFLVGIIDKYTVWGIKELRLGFLGGYEKEEVSPNKRIFGNKGYTKVTEICIKYAEDFGTTYYSSYKRDLDIILAGLLKGREHFLKLKADLDKFNFQVNNKEK